MHGMEVNMTIWWVASVTPLFKIPGYASEVRLESHETFQPSYTSSKVKNENHAIGNWISDFDKQHIPQPKIQ